MSEFDWCAKTLTLCHVTVCGQHLIPRRSGPGGVLPLQVGSICSVFASISVSYVPRFLGFAWCPRLCFCWNELCLACLLGLSVLVYFQSHGFLCSGQLQIFPVYLFLWNLHHSCDYKLQCFFGHIYCSDQRLRNKISLFDIKNSLIYLFFLHSV